MSIVISVPDAMRQSVEAATGGKNTVLYDAKGYPSVMVEIPKFDIEDVVSGAGSGVHPAFIVGGVTKPSIFIAKYQSMLHDGNALSLPGQDPAANIVFDDSIVACENKGSGWHLMTNAEWAAIALWAWKNGTMPRGNNNNLTPGTTNPEDVDAPWETAVKATTGSDGRSKTGSGPVGWYHDGTSVGIADLNGNIWEWCGGMRLNNGEIQVIKDNDAAMTGTDQTSGSALWKAIAELDGALVAPGTGGSVKYAGNTVDVTVGGDVSGVSFEAMTKAAGVTSTDRLKQLGLFPPGASLGGDGFWATTAIESLSLRGGSWSDDALGGVFALLLSNLRSDVRTSFGFRPAFVS